MGVKSTIVTAIQPLNERYTETETPRSRATDAVCNKLQKPAMSHEASFALQKAAWCVYVHCHSYEQLKETERLYNTRDSSLFRYQP